MDEKLYCIKEAIFFGITDTVVESDIPADIIESRLDHWNENSPDVYTDYYYVEQK